ncbi:MAG: hypothetical protein ACAI44_04925 [Candidatus Sericytochromatia bacterium]
MKKILLGFFGILVLNAVAAFSLLLAGFGIAQLFTNASQEGYNAVVVGFICAMSIGLLQAAYVIPLVFYLKRKQQPELLKGMLFGAGFTLLAPVVYCGGPMILFQL